MVNSRHLLFFSCWLLTLEYSCYLSSAYDVKGSLTESFTEEETGKQRSICVCACACVCSEAEVSVTCCWIEPRSGTCQASTDPSCPAVKTRPRDSKGNAASPILTALEGASQREMFKDVQKVSLKRRRNTQPSERRSKHRQHSKNWAIRQRGWPVRSTMQERGWQWKEGSSECLQGLERAASLILLTSDLTVLF